MGELLKSIDQPVQIGLASPARELVSSGAPADQCPFCLQLEFEEAAYKLNVPGMTCPIRSALVIQWALDGAR